MSSAPVSDLDAAWASIEAAISERGLLVYPSALDGADAPWPDGRSVEEFLDLAVALGVKVMYVEVNRFQRSDIDELGLGEEETETAAALLKLARKHVGRVATLELYFVFDGVTHMWGGYTDWWQQLAEGPEPGDGKASAPSEDPPWNESDYPVEEWVRLLAQDTEFQDAQWHPRAQTRVAKARIPDLAELAGETHGHGYWLLHRVIREATELYVEEYRPAREQALAAEAQALLDQGLPKYRVAAQLHLSASRLNRILGQYAGG